MHVTNNCAYASMVPIVFLCIPNRVNVTLFIIIPVIVHQKMVCLLSGTNNTKHTSLLRGESPVDKVRKLLM